MDPVCPDRGGGADAAGDVGSEHVADNFQDDVVENADVEETVVRALPSSHRPTPKEVGRPTT